MPTVISHGVAAFWAARMFHRSTLSPRLWKWTILCSLLPDVDVLAFALGFPYAHFLGHRGLTHSLAFALGLSVLVACSAFPRVKAEKRWRLILFLFLVTALHGLFDAMTDGGLGVAFFSPFDNTRYFLPWRPIQVSPIGLLAFLNPRGLQVLLSEIVWLWIPLSGTLLLKTCIARYKRRSG